MRPTITCDLFVYGSLRCKGLQKRLLKRKVKTLPARLEGFASLSVTGSPWPGLVRAIGRHAEGEVLLGLRPRDLARLDRYEGVEYARRLCRVWVQGTFCLRAGQARRDRPRLAWVYVWRDRRRLIGRSRGVN